MLRFGTISKVDPERGFVKVFFPEDDLESGWMSCIQGLSFGDKTNGIPGENTPVACVMDENIENGVCLGAVNNSQATPPYETNDKKGVKFEDGTEIYYDKESKKVFVNSAGTVVIASAGVVELTCDKLIISGDVEVSGNIEATGSISVPGVDLLTHTHSGVTTGPGASGPPVIVP